MRPNLFEAERVESIIGAFYTVYDYFGYGFAESVYSGALEYELIDRGHHVVRELSVAISYKGRHVAWQRIDMVVDSRVLLENKATEKIPPSAHQQVIVTPVGVGRAR